MIKDFVGVYENAYSQEYCARVIQYFDSMDEKGYSVNRQSSEGVSKTRKQDNAVFGTSEKWINLEASGDLHHDFNEIFWKCYADYAGTYDILSNSDKHGNFAYKIQKTPPGGGYHDWHCENNSRQHCHRIMAWILYLNDINDGGETEFLYQRLRITPTAGTLVMWPAAFTHTHRGNPPLKEDKYIVTGWLEF